MGLMKAWSAYRRSNSPANTKKHADRREIVRACTRPGSLERRDAFAALKAFNA